MNNIHTEIDQHIRVKVNTILERMIDKDENNSLAWVEMLDDMEALFLDAQANCNAVPDDQPNDIHIKYFNDGYKRGYIAGGIEEFNKGQNSANT